MARHEKPSGKGKIKFRFIEFEMDGNDPTLQDAIREITRAIGRPQMPKSQATLSGPNTDGQRGQILESAEDQEASATDQTADEENGADDHAVTERVSKPRRVKSPKIIQVELRGENPLRPFLEKIAATLDADTKKYLAIAYWFKTYRQTSEVTPDHIYTAYKEMNWTNLPKDVGATLRFLKTDGSFDKSQGKQAYALNHIGEGKVEDMINKAPSAQ